MIRATDWMDKGLMPVSGGWLEQSAQFLEAADFVRAERATAVASLNK